MEQEELIKFVEENIDYHMSEFDLPREDAEDVVVDNLIYWYLHDEISKDDMVNGAEYLGYGINLEAADKEKEKIKHRKELGEARKRRKKQCQQKEN